MINNNKIISCCFREHLQFNVYGLWLGVTGIHEIYEYLLYFMICL